jgi:Protein of unknown function (DUF2550)
VGGALALDAAWLFAAFLIILVLAAVGIAARRFLLERGGGTVECGLRRGPDGSWRLGVASYQREELNWFGALGLTMRPDVVFPRRDLTVVSRRLPTDAEAASLGPGMVVVECRLDEDSGQFGPTADDASGLGGGPGAGGTIELALGEEALTGLLAWLEAAPPGSHLGVAL